MIKILFLIFTLGNIFCEEKPVIRMIHGFLAPCVIEGMFLHKYFPNYDNKCIESGLGLFLSFEHQINLAC